MKRLQTFLAAAVLVVLGLAAPTSALADYRWHGGFHHRDIAHWRQGYWHHGRHGGRIGWWWVVGGLWYFYPAPVYPYPDIYRPPVVVEEVPAPEPGPPPTQYWYYCEPLHRYYPYVPSCPVPWRAVPAQP